MQLDGSWSFVDIRRAQIAAGVDSETIMNRFLSGALSAPRRIVRRLVHPVVRLRAARPRRQARTASTLSTSSGGSEGSPGSPGSRAAGASPTRPADTSSSALDALPAGGWS